MGFVEEVVKFIPDNEQEYNDKKIILDYIDQYRDNVLLRTNEIAHITSSGFIMNESLDKVLMIHHNIRGVWAWTGGHADGDSDLLHVAIKEAREETGVLNIAPLSKKIASVDILPVFGHNKRGKYVSSHLHLSIAYILICNELEKLVVKPDENTDVAWFETKMFTVEHFDAHDVYLYGKLIKRAKQYTK
ncbi:MULTISPECIES: NUDIX hydrolase [unclassified Clostridium]|uniref:NUDIX hydrolase n=1 Tax=unclassified Clostridium TaxID=2614128 RepID=UPI0025C3605B|nr:MULTISPECIES: NUDIX hydrolase [unclassified Clostridium]